jgi:mRNA-degrading endonuclease RelE of RelBE toxin-antitoxin system
MSTVIVHRSAAKYLQKLPKNRKERIKGILRELEKDPLDHAKGNKGDRQNMLDMFESV